MYHIADVAVLNAASRFRDACGTPWGMIGRSLIMEPASLNNVIIYFLSFFPQGRTPGTVISSARVVGKSRTADSFNCGRPTLCVVMKRTRSRDFVNHPMMNTLVPVMSVCACAGCAYRLFFFFFRTFEVLQYKRLLGKSFSCDTYCRSYFVVGVVLLLLMMMMTTLMLALTTLTLVTMMMMMRMNMTTTVMMMMESRIQFCDEKLVIAEQTIRMFC